MVQRTVLVVEDEPAILALLSLVLETRDYKVVTAVNGREALTRIRNEPPDAILLDLMLPGVDGWAVIDTLGQRANEDRIPVIAMSAGRRRVSPGQPGVTAFLSKPFDVQGLLGLLEDAFES